MKPILSVLLTLVLCLSLFACGKQPVETPTEPPTEAPTAAPTEPATEPPTEAPTEPEAPEVPVVGSDNYLFTFTDGQENPVLTLTASLPACESLPQIDAYYKALYDDLYATCTLNAEEAAQRRAEFVTDGLDFTPWVVEVKCAVTRNDGKTLSVLRDVYEHFGGPYPTVSCQAETFDVATQGRLLLSDLFVEGADYATRLPVTEPDQLNFALTGGFVLLCDGEGTVSVPLSDLSDILLPQYLSE